MSWSRLRPLLVPWFAVAVVAGLTPPAAAADTLPDRATWSVSASGGVETVAGHGAARDGARSNGAGAETGGRDGAAPAATTAGAMAGAMAGDAQGAGGGPGPAAAAPTGGDELVDVHTGLDGDGGGAPVAQAPAAEGVTGHPTGVAEGVRAAIDADGEAPVLVRLREQPDMTAVEAEAAQAGRAAAAAAGREQHGARNAGQLARDAERTARGHAVVSALKSVAEQSQPAVRGLLDAQAAQGHVAGVHEFWIFNGFAATVDAAGLAALAEHPDVQAITLDETIELSDPIPAEPGEPALPVWSLENINAPDVWGEYGVRGEGIVVGVMDSGVDGEHPALAATWRGNDGDPEASWFVPTGENYPEPGDGHGHGTHVTGSIVGAPPGEVTGVAPDAEWIGAKIFTDVGSTTESIIQTGFEWMLAPGGDPAAAPHVVNNSWGSDATHSTTYWDAVAAWVAAGIVPIFSNGNAGPGTGTVGSPASFPHSIGIGATDEQDRIAWFSSRGPVVWDGVEYAKPQLSAPGYQVFSAWPADLPDGPYHTISGTSMAAPHATGVVALLLSANPGLTVDEVREALETTARSESHMAAVPDAYGAGVVDAYAAVTQVAHSGTVTGTVTGTDGDPVAAELAAAGVSATTADPDGSYRLWLAPGTHQLTATAYGYQPWTGEVTVAAGGTVTRDIALASAPDAEVSGVVNGPAGPLPGARVTLSGTPVPAVRTGADGQFALPVAEGNYGLRVTAPGHEPATVQIEVTGATAVEVTLGAVSVPPAPGWAQYQNNPARTGLSADGLAAGTLAPGWNSHAGGEVFFSSPVIADGQVFVNTDQGELVAFDLTGGDEQWRYDVGAAGLRGAPAVADGVVYLGGGADGGFHAVDAETGEPVWTFPTPQQRTIYTTPVVEDGVVYASTGFTPDTSDTVYALSAATGDELWSVDVGERAFFGPAVGEGLVVATSAGEQRMMALDAATGAEVWSLTREADEFISGPSIADGSVYVTTSVPPAGSAPGFQGSLLAVDAGSGQLRWEVDSHGDGQGTVPAVHGDLVIAGSHGMGVVAAYHRDTGEPAWHYGLPSSGGVSASLLVSGDGFVVGGSQLDQRIFALDADTGELVWEQDAGSNVLASPAYAEGRLVTAESNGAVRTFQPTGQLTGTVTGPDGPLPATVRASGTAHETEAGEDGGYELTGLPPGEYTVEVSHFGYAAQTRAVTVAAGQSVTADFALAAVADGALSGTVTDEAGQPLPGATVTLPETPLDPVETGPAGGYQFDPVAAGSYQLVVDADGYARAEEQVTITAGETTVADFALARFDVAVVADYENRVTDQLADAGWQVERVSFAQLDGTVDRYGAVVLAGQTGDRADADPERFARIIDQADAAGTSLVFLDTGGPSYGSVRALSQVTGDPAADGAELGSRGEVWLSDVVDHPITDSLPSGRVPVLESGSWHAWFSDYSGHSLAVLGNDQQGPRGAGIGYQRRTLDSNHVLLPAAAPSPWSDWQPAMVDLLRDAVDHAAQARYGAAGGQVTGADGEPIPAQVEVVDGLEQTVATDDGQWQLILEPGEYTLRFHFLGAQSVERELTVTAGQTHQLDVSLPAAERGTLTGQVTAQGSDRPVTGAQVALPGSGLPGATTGADGRYVIADIPGGSYDLEVTAEGYEPLVIEEVTVTDGEVTEQDAVLARAPGVVVVGDNNGEITEFLEAHAIPAEEAGWEVVDDLAGVEVVILHNPPDPGREEFLAALAAFDAAGVSVIFPADGWSFRTRGVDLLVSYTGSPSDYGRLGGLNGPEIYLHQLADHQLFDGIEGDPVQLLTASSEAAHFPDYQGVVLAQVAEAGADPAGIGVAYDVRTPDNVHLLLTGLASTFRNNPDGSWTPDGQQIFLNAVRWAAAPAQGGLTGTVTDADGQPIPHAEVTVEGTHWRAVTDAGGGFEIGVPPGEHTLRYSAFGYEEVTRTVTVVPDQRLDASEQLALGEVGSITGVVSSAGGGALAEVEVDLRGTPHRTMTGPDGSYSFPLVEPGSYELELETEEHVRTLSGVNVAAGETADHDVALRPSPLVGIVDDSDFSNSRDRGEEFLTDWGYEVEDIGFDSLDRIGELDLVVANVSDFGLELSAGELRAFEETVNRAAVPVLWLGQHGRGAIQFLHEHENDPAVLGEGFNDGQVTATVAPDAADHPLVAGLPEEFPLIADGGRYSFFDEFGGTTVATLATGDGGELGSTVAYRGRTAGTVDVLLSTLSVTTWGAPGTRQSPALHWTPAAERLFVNALDWALDADGIGAEVRGTVTGPDGQRLKSQVEVLETGRTYDGRDGDGTFLVPLPAGEWTLQVSAFGHVTETVPVSVAAGEVRAADVTLAAEPAGTVAGTVTGPDGAPVPEAQVSLVGTPRSASTGAGGDYQLAVPEGDWTLRITADGHRAAELPVTVAAGETTTADAQLAAGAAVAIVDTTGASTHGTSVAQLLTTEGYEVDLVPRGELAELAAQVDDYQLVIFNATLLSSQHEAFLAVVDAAAEAGVSTIHTSQHGGSHAIPQLSSLRGDPESTDWGFVSVGIDYLPEVDHPIFAGFPADEPIELITSTLSNLNQQYGSFDGWSGETIAQVQGRTDGEDLGAGVGYRFTSSTSVELLLGSLTAGSHGWPEERWTGAARQVYRNAVAWAIDARQAELSGVVTGDGEPLAGATVTSQQTGQAAVTAGDGAYTLGLSSGTHTIEVAAFGFQTTEETVQVPESGTVALDVDLVPLPRSELTGTVRSTAGKPVADAEIVGTGAVDFTATSGEDGRFTADGLLAGEYQVSVTAGGFLPGEETLTVVSGEPATLEVSLQPTDVAVLGDSGGALTAYLREQGVPAAELTWDAGLDLAGYRVVVVNGGDPDAETFAAVLDAADAAGASLVFTGTWAADRGGIRLLERHTDRVVVGEQGYGDGPVQLTGFDPAHPMFAGLGDDPATLIADGGYYSVLDEYAGLPLADLRVPREGGDPVTGLAAGWDWRTDSSVEVLLSASAVTEAVGPDLGWTPQGGRLVVDAIAWVRDQAVEAPGTPTLAVPEPLVLTETVTASGAAGWPAQVTVHRNGEPVATVEVEQDGTWSAAVPLAVGDNELTAVAANSAGESPPSPAVSVARWHAEWEVRGQGDARPVTLELTGPPARPAPGEQAELVVLDATGEEVRRAEMSWVSGFYLHVLRDLPPGEYTLRAELMVDGRLVVSDGPALD